MVSSPCNGAYCGDNHDEDIHSCGVSVQSLCGDFDGRGFQLTLDDLFFVFRKMSKGIVIGFSSFVRIGEAFAWGLLIIRDG